MEPDGGVESAITDVAQGLARFARQDSLEHRLNRGFSLSSRSTCEASATKIQFLAAVVDGDGVVDEEASANFLMQARHAARGEMDGGQFLPDERLYHAVAAARAWAGAAVTTRQQDVERAHNDVLESKLDSLRQGFERRRSAVSRQLDEAQEGRIIRMRRGQLANIEEDYRRKRADLEQRRGVEVGYGLVAAGVIS